MIARSSRFATKYGPPRRSENGRLSEGRDATVSIEPAKHTGASGDTGTLTADAAGNARISRHIWGRPAALRERGELECAKIFDYYGVPWSYEPRTFVLESDDDGQVVEAFTPDFYLPSRISTSRSP